MSWVATDGILIIAILVGTYYAYQAIPDTLNHVRNLAVCPEQPGPGLQKQLQKDTENAISIDTLRVLSEGHSHGLRVSTIKIVSSRTLKSRTKKLLLKDLASNDEDKRYQALCAMWMFVFNPSLQAKSLAQEFLDYKTFHAIITALKNVLADHKPNQHMHLLTPGNPLYPEPKIPPSPVRPPVRPYQETSLMMILRTLIVTSGPYDRSSNYGDNMTCALSAGLVTRWLKDYPFPCTLPQNAKYNYKRSNVVNLLERRIWGMDEPLMAELIHDIAMNPVGKKQLREVGLLDSKYAEIEDVENAVSRWRRFPTRHETFDTDRDVRMTNGESTAGAATPPPFSNRRRLAEIQGDHTAQARTQELSHEEESLRRRRREAVVVADPGVPLTEDNILQRTDSGNVWEDTSRVSADGTDAVINSAESTPTNEPMSISFEDRFNVMIRQLLGEQIMLQQLRDMAVHNHDLEDPAISDGFNQVMARMREARDLIERVVGAWEISEAERVEFLRRLNNITIGTNGLGSADSTTVALVEDGSADDVSESINEHMEAISDSPLDSGNDLNDDETL